MHRSRGSPSCSTRWPRRTTSSTGPRGLPVRLSELPQLLRRQPLRSELVYLLVRLDKEYVESKPAEA